jgi:hypothetical protein
MPRPIYPREKSPPPSDTHWIEGWVGQRANLDAVAKRELSAPVGNLTLVIQTLAKRYTNKAISAHIRRVKKIK